MVGLIKQANDLIRLWRLAGPGTPAIDLKLLFSEVVLKKSEGIGCTIVEAPFDSFEGLLALHEPSGEWRIGINTNIAYAPRRNFTLAHEIGHFVGHRKHKAKFECTFENLTDYQKDPLEVEANEFASHLLMPPDVIRKATDNMLFCHEAVSEISGMLGVSRAAAAYRWVKLSSKSLGFLISRDGFICSGRASDSLYRSGTYFKSGAEVPNGAKLHKLTETGSCIAESCGTGVWNPLLEGYETSYATRQGGYVYTYLDYS